MTREEIGARIRELRLAAGISQEQAARHAGVHLSTWARYERAERLPSIDHLTQVARALDRPAGALLDPHVIAELRLDPTTLADLRARGPQAVDQYADRLAQALRPALHLATTDTPPPPRWHSTGKRQAPLEVAQRLERQRERSYLRARDERERIERAQAVE